MCFLFSLVQIIKDLVFKTFFCFIMFVFVALHPQELTVSESQSNSVKFLATSTLSDFSGTTSAIEGFIKWDSSQTNNNQVEMKVFLDSLDTGIGLRNTHMREKYLETNKFPFAQFIGKITNGLHKSNIDSLVIVEGTLKIHGVEKQEKFLSSIKKVANLYELQTGFRISLSDFNIDQPSFLFVSVDDNIFIECTVYLKK